MFDRSVGFYKRQLNRIFLCSLLSIILGLLWPLNALAMIQETPDIPACTPYNKTIYVLDLTNLGSNCSFYGEAGDKIEILSLEEISGLLSKVEVLHEDGTKLPVKNSGSSAIAYELSKNGRYVLKTELAPSGFSSQRLALYILFVDFGPWEGAAENWVCNNCQLNLLGIEAGKVLAPYLGLFVAITVVAFLLFVIDLVVDLEKCSQRIKVRYYVNRFISPVIDKVYSASRILEGERWLLVFCITPLLLLLVQNTLRLRFDQMVWVIQIYFCLLWALFIYSSLDLTKRMLTYGLNCLVITVISSLFFLALVTFLPVSISINLPSPTLKIFTAFAIVAFLEELCKALPLFWLLHKNSVLNPRAWLFLGAMSGLGFAIGEGFIHTIIYTSTEVHFGFGINYWSSYSLQILFYLMSSPILHASLTGIVGWFSGIGVLSSSGKWVVAILAIMLLAIPLHFLYDFFSGTVWGLFLATVIVTVFLHLMRRDWKTPIRSNSLI